MSRDGQCKWIVSTVGMKLVVRNTTRLLRPFQYDNRVFGVKFSPNGERLETLRPTHNVHWRWWKWKIASPAFLVFVRLSPHQPILRLEVS